VLLRGGFAAARRVRETCTNKYYERISKPNSGGYRDGVRHVHHKNPSSPATKRLTIDNVYGDAEPDAFDAK
jgi:hypothetical protein